MRSGSALFRGDLHGQVEVPLRVDLRGIRPLVPDGDLRRFQPEPPADLRSVRVAQLVRVPVRNVKFDLNSRLSQRPVRLFDRANDGRP